jgi:hypothetical protein
LQISKDSPEFYEQLWRAYGCYQGDFQQYVATHFRRFLLTLDLLPVSAGLRVLELGTSAPFPFSLMIRARLPDVRMFINHEDTNNQHGNVVLRAASDSHEDIVIPAAGYNIETTTWPHEDETFDIVLLTEVLEHLLLNPLAVFSEAARVLVPGGRFILTTPNIACLESVQSILDFRSPYTYGVYSKHGPYGRHNREFIPSEIERLGRACGFETDLLTTHDCYGFRCDVSEARSILNRRNDTALQRQLRGQVIFYVGRKSAGPRGPFPAELFDFDPVSHRCKIELAPSAEPPRISGDLTMMELQVQVTNEGELTWQRDSEDRTRLGVQVLAEDGSMIARDWLRCELPADVPPGASERIAVRTYLPGPDTKLRACIYRFDMVHEFVTWFGDIPAGGRMLELRLLRQGGNGDWSINA